MTHETLPSSPPLFSRRSMRIGALAAIMLTTAVSFLAFDPFGFRIEDNVPLPMGQEHIPDHAVRVPTGDFCGVKATLPIRNGETIEFFYRNCSDSGVMVTRKDGAAREIWRRSSAGLGVHHKEYCHHVSAMAEGDVLTLISQGSKDAFGERIDLRTGRLLARSVRKT